MKPRVDRTIVTVHATREGEEPLTDRQSYPGTFDTVCKKLRGLTSKQAYDLKVNGSVTFEQGGWHTVVSIEEIVAETRLN